MRLEKIIKDFNLFGIETHPIPSNPHGLRTKRTNPDMEQMEHAWSNPVNNGVFRMTPYYNFSETR
jgi:hypothetical protein